MRDLQNELANFELDELDLNALSMESIELSGVSDLSTMTTGHGMIEVGASGGDTACCSCCLACCCCCCA